MTRLGAIFAALACAGCARPWIALPPDEAPKLAADRPRVVVFVPQKRIFLREHLDKFFWTENREYSYCFDGLWDPAPFLEEQVVESLRSRWKLQAVSVRKDLSPEATARLEERTGGAALARGPDEFPKARVADALRELRREGSEYLFEVYLEDLTVFHSGSGSRLIATVGARLIRLSDGAVVWFRDGEGRSSLPGLASFSELERDMLFPLKQHYGQAVLDLVSPDASFLGGLGVPPPSP